MVDDWTATRDTLHMWTQIVGKIRMVHMPLINHWWQVTLYVSPRGLTTGAVPYRDAVFDMEFDFVSHVLAIRHSDGGQTAGVVPAAADEVSALTAVQFAGHAQLYKAVSAQAAVVHDLFVTSLAASADSYAATEAANTIAAR
jgi:hypothetical protein